MQGRAEWPVKIQRALTLLEQSSPWSREAAHHIIDDIESGRFGIKLVEDDPDSPFLGELRPMDDHYERFLMLTNMSSSAEMLAHTISHEWIHRVIKKSVHRDKANFHGEYQDAVNAALSGRVDELKALRYPREIFFAAALIFYSEAEAFEVNYELEDYGVPHESGLTDLVMLPTFIDANYMAAMDVSLGEVLARALFETAEKTTDFFDFWLKVQRDARLFQVFKSRNFNAQNPADTLLAKAFEKILATSIYSATLTVNENGEHGNHNFRWELLFKQPDLFTMHMPDKPTVDVLGRQGELLTLYNGPKEYTLETMHPDNLLNRALGDSLPGILFMLEGSVFHHGRYRAQWIGKRASDDGNLGLVEIFEDSGNEEPPSFLIAIDLDRYELVFSALIEEDDHGHSQTTTVRISGADFQGLRDEEYFAKAPPRGYIKRVKEKGAHDKFLGKKLANVLLEDVASRGKIESGSMLGQPMILEYWATWCAQCNEAMPVLERAYRQGLRKGFKVMAVSNEDREMVHGFLDRYSYEMNYYLDPARNLMKTYEVVNLPVTLAIDAAGIIRGVEVGYRGPEGLEDLIAHLGIRVDLSAP